MPGGPQDHLASAATGSNSTPEQNRFEQEKHFHAVRLGKHRKFLRTCTQDLGKLRIVSQQEHRDADDDGGVKPMVGNRRLCASHGYGRDSVWPPFDPGRSRKEFEYEVTRHGNLVGQWWLKLNRLLLGSETVIQDAIIRLSRGDIKDANGKTLDIEHYLEVSWRAARDKYNTHHATEPGDMTSGFRLDPEGEITPNRSTDLDVFALVYLTSQSADNPRRDPERYRHDPLYRNGANYMDDRKAFDEALLSDEKFQRLRKPGPNNKGKVKFNINVEEFLEKHRASFLVPHINALDLTNTANLLLFIHYRGRWLPREFAYQDYDRMYLGACTRILTGACDPTCAIYFKKFTDKNEPGFPVKPMFLYQHKVSEGGYDELLEGLARDGMPLHGMGGWLILQSQAITCLFLTSFCEQMLHLAKSKPIDDPLNSMTYQQVANIEKAAGETINKILGNGHETLDEMEAVRQYELYCDGTDFGRYEHLFLKQRDEAEQHIKILFDEPDYFARKVIEEKEHHWDNLRVGYDEVKPGAYIQKYYDDTGMRHALYLDCMRTVLRRAFFDFFIWEAVRIAVASLQYIEDRDFVQDTQLQYVGGGKGVLAWREQICSDEASENYMMNCREVQIFLRQTAAFFLYEFRKKAIHATSAPMRDTYCIPNADKKPADLAGGFYETPDIELGLRHQASPDERSQVPRMVLELIENFISNKPSSMFVGMRKTTARILRYFEECKDDKETSEKFSDPIRDNIKSLSILSEVVDQMDQHLPNAFHLLEWKDEFEQLMLVGFTEILESAKSYDLVSLNGCSFGTKHVPEKRLGRIFSFLDEVQGLGSRNENSYGTARGDIKRFGSSLLKGLIYPLARKDKNLDYDYHAKFGFDVTNDPLERLTKHMEITNDQWSFKPNEAPWKFLDDADEDNRKHFQGIWKDLKDSMLELSKKNRKNLKKPWAKSSKSLNMYDFVADEVKLARAMADMSKRQMKECVKKRKAKKKNLDLRRKRQEEAIQRELETEDVVMQDAPGQNIAPDTTLPPGGEDNPEGIEQPVQEMEIDAEIAPEAEPEPEPEPEPPQVPVPIPAVQKDVPKEKLSKGCWAFWDALFSDEAKPKLKWSQFENALDKIGFEPDNKGSSHMKYNYKPGIEPYPGVTSLDAVKPHGKNMGENTNVAPAIVNKWRHHTLARGLTREKLEERFSRP